jgi:hypothetical protein
MIEAENVEDPVVAYLKAHYRPDVAADLLAAAQPLMAIAWDEGYDRAKSDHYGTGFWTKRLRGNPYMRDTAGTNPSETVRQLIRDWLNKRKQGESE